MKIHWFTPLPPERTDVGHFSVRVCEELSRYCELVLWTHPRHFTWINRRREKWTFTIRPYSDVDVFREELNRSDAIFYNIGNNAAFHREIIMILREFPGVAIMHDLSLFECISSIYRERLGGEQLFVDLVKHVYSETEALAVQDWLLADEEKRASLDVAGLCPFAAHAVEGAWGLVSHTEIQESNELASGVHSRWCLPLPYSAPSDPGHRDAPGPVLQLAVFGYIGGPNRRLHEILEAMAAYADVKSLYLHVIGDVNPALEVDQKIKELGLESRVKVHGFVKETELDRLLGLMDLVLNLRFPTRGEASGSLLRAWSCGVAVAVSNTGFYANLPDTVVWKIDPSDEQASLWGLWDTLKHDPGMLIERGRAGYVYLREKHAVQPYVESLIEIAKTPDLERGPAALPLLQKRFGLMAANTIKLPGDLGDELVRKMDDDLASWFAEN